MSFSRRGDGPNWNWSNIVYGYRDRDHDWRFHEWRIDFWWSARHSKFLGYEYFKRLDHCHGDIQSDR